MTRLRRVLTCAAAAVVLAGACAVASGPLEPSEAEAGPGLIVGVHDDTLKWTWPGWRFIAAYEDLKLSAIRVTLRWRPGEGSLDRLGRLYVDRVANAVMDGNRVVLAVYGGARTAPATLEERESYCEFVVDALRRAPMIRDVVIWNEVNSPSFWRPQRDSAASYFALLAQCYDTVRENFRRHINLISSIAPRHDPRTFIAKLGSAYRASGRKTRIFDTFGHNPYPATSHEAPYVEHRGTRVLGQGDYGTLMKDLTAAFGGTAQPVPGEQGVKVWYLENGFETAVPFERAARYFGREVAKVIEPVLSSVRRVGLARDQASQLRDALGLAYCQPAVGAYFNFQLVDEEGLGGWQSGLLWADGSRKPSYGAFKRAVRQVADGDVDCSRFPASARGIEPIAPSLPLSSMVCCERSSSTSTSRSPGQARTSARRATGS
jgi:hypothetical protein